MAHLNERIEALKRDIIFEKITLNDAWSYQTRQKKQGGSDDDAKTCMTEVRDRGEVCSVKEAAAIVEWAVNNKQHFQTHSFQQWFLPLTSEVGQKLNPPRFINDIKDRIVKREKLHGYMTEPVLGDFINILERGTAVQLHQDRNYQPNLIHVRYNVHVQAGAGEDGLQICCNRIIKCPERHYTRCLAGMEPHKSTEICTNRARIGLSFGFLIPLPELDIFEFTPAIF